MIESTKSRTFDIMMDSLTSATSILHAILKIEFTYWKMKEIYLILYFYLMWNNINKNKVQQISKIT